jgi:hypothetical protein
MLAKSNDSDTESNEYNGGERFAENEDGENDEENEIDNKSKNDNEENELEAEEDPKKPGKSSGKKQDWGLILGRKDVFVHQLANTQVNGGFGRVRYYSTVQNSRNLASEEALNPNFVTGLIDAEGSFMISVRRHSKNKNN